MLIFNLNNKIISYYFLKEKNNSNELPYQLIKIFEIDINELLKKGNTSFEIPILLEGLIEPLFLKFIQKYFPKNKNYLMAWQNCKLEIKFKINDSFFLKSSVGCLKIESIRSENIKVTN